VCTRVDTFIGGTTIDDYGNSPQKGQERVQLNVFLVWGFVDEGTGGAIMCSNICSLEDCMI